MKCFIWILFVLFPDLMQPALAFPYHLPFSQRSNFLFQVGGRYPPHVDLIHQVTYIIPFLRCVHNIIDKHPTVLYLAKAGGMGVGKCIHVQTLL